VRRLCWQENDSMLGLRMHAIDAVKVFMIIKKMPKQPNFWKTIDNKKITL
jgi:hypothetical protein